MHILKPLPSLAIDFATYYNQGKDFQYFIGTGDTIDGDRPVLQRTNISGIRIFGTEANFTWTPNKWLQFKGNYAYNHSIITDFDLTNYFGESLEGKLISETPPHQYYLAAILYT